MAFEALDVGEAVHTTTEPKPAAYAQLTAAEATAVADLPTAETFSHSPGANPFWRLGYYPFGVFPEATRSVYFIDFDENIQGLRELESRHPDRTNLFSIGKGHGKYNYATDRTDPREAMVVEITNDVDDRETDASVYTAGQTTHQTITATTDDASADGRVADTVPGFWDVADVESLENGRQRVVFEPAADGEVDCFAEAPDGLGSTGRCELGPVEVDVDGEWRSVGGTGSTVSVVGVET